MEVGPKDIANECVLVKRRDNSEACSIPMVELAGRIPILLEDIQIAMFEKAKADRDAKLVKVTEWKDFIPALNNQCIVLTPFCNETEWEKKVKEKSRAEGGGDDEADTDALSVAAKSLCIPFDQVFIYLFIAFIYSLMYLSILIVISLNILKNKQTNIYFLIVTLYFSLNYQKVHHVSSVESQQNAGYYGEDLIKFII